jgi:hypothetical protein
MRKTFEEDILLYYENKTKSAYDGISIYYILDVVNLLHGSVTYGDHLQEGVFGRIYYEDTGFMSF